MYDKNAKYSRAARYTSNGAVRVDPNLYDQKLDYSTYSSNFAACSGTVIGLIILILFCAKVYIMLVGLGVL